MLKDICIYVCTRIAKWMIATCVNVHLMQCNHQPVSSWPNITGCFPEPIPFGINKFASNQSSPLAIYGSQWHAILNKQLLALISWNKPSHITQPQSQDLKFSSNHRTVRVKLHRDGHPGHLRAINLLESYIASIIFIISHVLSMQLHLSFGSPLRTWWLQSYYL